MTPSTSAVRRLLLQGLARLGDQAPRFPLHHRLRSKILQERNIFFGKQPNLLTAGNNLAESGARLAQWNKQNRAMPADFERGHVYGSANVRHIRCLHNPRRSAARGSGAQGRPEPLPQPIGKSSVRDRGRYRAIFLTIIDIQLPNAAPHSLCAFFQYHLEHRSEVAGRRIDYLQDLGGRGLLVERLAPFGDQRAFSIAITACAAKFWSSAICLSVKRAHLLTNKSRSRRAGCRPCAAPPRHSCGHRRAAPAPAPLHRDGMSRLRRGRLWK